MKRFRLVRFLQIAGDNLPGTCRTYRYYYGTFEVESLESREVMRTHFLRRKVWA